MTCELEMYIRNMLRLNVSASLNDGSSGHPDVVVAKPDDVSISTNLVRWARFGAILLLGCLHGLWAQPTTAKIDHVVVRGTGPAGCQPTWTNPGVAANGIITFTFSEACRSQTISGSISLALPPQISGSFSSDRAVCGNTLFNACFVPSSAVRANASITSASCVIVFAGMPCENSAPFVQIQVGAGFASTPSNCSAQYFGTLSDKDSTVTVTGCTLPLVQSSDPTAGPQQAVVSSAFAAQNNSLLASFGVDVFYANTNVTADLMITAVHVVQAIQTPLEDVTIVAGRQTVARVFIKSVGPHASAVPNVTARLRCSIVSSPFQNFGANPGSPPITAQPIAAPPDPGAPPDLSEPSVDFIIPQICSQTQQAISLTADIVLPAGITDPNMSNNTFTRSVGFAAVPVNPFRIAYVRIPYQPPGQAAATFADAAHVARASASFRLMYPVSQVEYFPLAIDYPAWTHPLISIDDWVALLKDFSNNMDLNNLISDQAYDQVVGWVPYVAGTQAGGIAGTRPFGMSGTTALALDSGDDAYDQRQVFAHEIGHNMGLRHVITAADHAAGCPVPGGDPATSGWPWSDGHIQTPGYFIPTMRPLPKTDYDLMTYCPPDTLWISPYAAETVYQNGMVPPDGPARQIVFGDLPRAMENRGRLSTAQDLWLVSGSIRADNSAATLDSFLKITSTQPPAASDSSGKYCINFTGTGTRFCFTLSFVDSEGNTLAEQPFTFLIASAPNATGATLTAAGQTLTSAAAQANLAVSITSPQAGAQWQVGPQTISWNSNAAGAARYAVQYSYDGGTNWLTLASNLTAPQLTVNASKLLGRNVRLRVLAGSGVSTASDEVGPITIAQAPAIQVAPTLDLHGAVSTQSVDRTFSISNSGTGPLRITAITSTDPQFQVVAPLTPTIVMAGESADLIIRFTPSASTAVTAQLRIESNDATQPVLTVALHGTGVDSAGPEMAVDQTSVDFGSTLQGQSSTRTVTVTNFGAADLTVQSIAITGPFVLGQNPAPVTLQPGQNVVLNIRFVPQSAGGASGTLTVNGSDAAHASIVINLTGTGAPSGNVTLPQVRAAENAATFTAGLTRGALGTVFGANLASATAQQTTTPWVTILGGVKVIIAGIAVPLYYVSATQINFQVPYETPLGSASLIVSRDGYENAAVQVNIVDYAPGVFQYARTATAIDPIVVHSSTNQLVSPTNPVAAQEYLVAYLTGFGKLRNPPPTGNGASGFLLSSSIDPVTATFGGAPATVLFAGLTPGFIGLVQINVQVGALPSGSCAALVFQVASVSSPPANLATGAAGCAPPTAPALSVNPTSLDFGTVAVGQTSPAKTITVTNSGTAAATITLSTSPPYAVSPTSLNVPLNSTGNASVTFTPTAAGASPGTLNITISGQSTPAASVALTGSGTASSAANFTGQWNTDFGPMSLTQTGASVTGTYPNFNGTISGTVTGNVLNANWSDNTGTGTLRFTQSVDGNSFTGTWTRLTGSGNPGGTWNGTRVSTTPDVVLKIDGGAFDAEIGYPNGTATAYFVNRLTPPSYPATIKSVQIFFSTRPDGLQVNAPLTIISATNPSGSSTLSLTSANTDRVTAKITALDSFITYTVPSRTITSGDFVVGFMVQNPPGIYPADQDQLTTPQRRSYTSNDGTNYILIDSAGPDAAGNLAIRAVVTPATATSRELTN